MDHVTAMHHAAAMAHNHLEVNEIAELRWIEEMMAMAPPFCFNDVVLRCSSCDTLTTFQVDVFCCACGGSGESYWSDGIDGTCTECIGYVPTCKLCDTYQETPWVLEPSPEPTDNYPEIHWWMEYVPSYPEPAAV